MSKTKMTSEKVRAIIADIKMGMKVIPLQIKHGVSQPTIYGNPAVRAVLLGRLKKIRQKQLEAVVIYARKGKMQKDIAVKVGISAVTVTKYLNKAVKLKLMTPKERQDFKHRTMSATLKGMWAMRKKQNG